VLSLRTVENLYKTLYTALGGNEHTAAQPQCYRQRSALPLPLHRVRYASKLLESR
jgi:hypothetical protein